LLAHARVFHLYKREYGEKHNGVIGIANCGDFRYGNAGERAMLFQWGWFTDPLIFGDYPTAMRDRLGDRLPSFTPDEAASLVGSFDFLGLNYYEAMLATTPDKESEYPGYWADIHATFRFVEVVVLLLESNAHLCPSFRFSCQRRSHMASERHGLECRTKGSV
jgi:beta-glucosidase/6-phospho-beta-glucosidase/beta-galactosidase